LAEIGGCAESAKVTLVHESAQKTEVIQTNNYGDFKFDNLKENSGRYRLEIEVPSYEKQTRVIELKTSINMGTIFYHLDAIAVEGGWCLCECDKAAR
jgi:hypothetical protein